ncbi:MAG: response regulator transcription factor [bacterium]
MKILLVEDDFTSRTILADMLKKSGYEIVEASGGSKAWEILQKPDSPKLVILDWIMPVMDGMEVLNRVRNLQTDKPPYIMMLTSKTEKEEIIRGLNSGADDYLTKPFDSDELRARVEVGRRMVEIQNTLFDKVEKLRLAMEEIKTLRGILPICSKCKKVRDDKGYWHQVETYLQKHSDAEFSHGICNECAEKLYPDFVAGKKRKNNE